jgi:tRNA (guanosine-2'-O-)-methyltransferase
MESIYHRHNTSAILRSADSFGVMDVHLIPGKLTPSKGPSRGVKRWLNIHDHPNTAEAIKVIKDQGYALWVADFQNPPISPNEIPLDKPVCLWFGAEFEGVSPEARAAADGVVTIPMRGFSQSLNVSVASAVILQAVCERARTIHGDKALLSPDVRKEVWEIWRKREELKRAEIRKRSHPV